VSARGSDKGSFKGSDYLQSVHQEEIDEDLALELRHVNLKESTQHRIVFRKIPYHLWIVGICIFIVAIYLISTLALGYFGVLYKGKKQG
jgi:hypothetical protein